MEELYFVRVGESINWNAFNQLTSYISNERREILKRLCRGIDMKLALYSDVLVRILAVQNLEVNNSDLQIDKGKYGKPYIKNQVGFNYNISHTENAIVVAVSDHPIGVDIEKLRPAYLPIAQRFFFVDEQEYIYGSKDEVDNRFYEIWTKKEAYIKYTGVGFSQAFRPFTVVGNTVSAFFYTFNLYDYVISYCCDSKEITCIKELTEKEVEEQAVLLLDKAK